MSFNHEQEKFEYIEAYLTGQMRGEDLLIFEKRLEEDQDFATEVENIRLTIDLIEEYSLSQQVKQVHAQAMITYYKYERINRLLKISLFGFASLLMMLTMVLYLFTPASKLHEKYQAMARPLAPMPCTSERAQSVSTDPVVAAYKDCNYRLCVDQYEKTTAPSAKATYMAANAYLALSNLPQAQECFRQLQNNSMIGHEASWYLAAIDLQNNDPLPAENMLGKIYKNDPHNNFRQTLEWQLILYYLKNDQAEAADHILANADVPLKLKAQVKLLKWADHF